MSNISRIFYFGMIFRSFLVSGNNDVLVAGGVVVFGLNSLGHQIFPLPAYTNPSDVKRYLLKKLGYWQFK